MNKRITVVTGVVVLLLTLLYAFMCLNTNSVITDFVSCVRGENVTETLKGTELYNWYGGHDSNADKINIDIKRCFVIHDFSKGIMNVKYSFEKYDESGNRLKGASNINAKWYIQMQNNRWIVVRIQEIP